MAREFAACCGGGGERSGPARPGPASMYCPSYSDSLTYMGKNPLSPRQTVGRQASWPRSTEATSPAWLRNPLLRDRRLTVCVTIPWQDRRPAWWFRELNKRCNKEAHVAGVAAKKVRSENCLDRSVEVWSTDRCRSS